MANQVGTRYVYNMAMKDIMTAQNSLIKTQVQISSGLKSSTFPELAKSENLDSYFSINNSLQRIDTYQRNNDLIEVRINAMEKAIDSIQIIAGEFVSKLQVYSRGSSRDSMDAPKNVELQLDTIGGLLNQRSGDCYLFSGTRTDTAPIGNALGTNSNLVNFQPTANYYEGDDYIMSAQISDSLKIEYGINANDPAFQNLIGAMNLLSIGVQEKDDFLIQQSLDMSNKAINGLVGLRTKIGNCGKSLKSEKVSNIAVKNYLDEVKQGIIATDLSAASEKMHALVAGIQASYMATTKLNSMSIVDKMR